MTYQPLPGAPNAPQLNLAPFTLDQVPIGSSIICRVKADGVDASGDPTSITIETAPVLVTDSFVPANPVIQNLALTDLVVGDPVTATATISYEGGDLAQMEADGWSVEWNWSSQQSGGSFPFTVNLTYSQTTDYRYRSPDDGTNLRNIETKTITWTVGSNSLITHGTFLDGSPWVIDNGDLHLISVTPEPGVFIDTSPNFGREWVTNQTIINPDFGKVPSEYTGQQVTTYPTEQENNWPTAIDFVVRCDNNEPLYYTDDPIDQPKNRVPMYMLALDGRSGITSKEKATGSGLTDHVPIGEFYTAGEYQIWDRNTVKIENGDMILSSISHTDQTQMWGGFEREPLYDLLGCLTVVDQNRTGFFRPPVNWDPTDKLNRPFLQMRSDLDTFNFDYPPYGLRTESPDYETAKLEDWFDMDKRLNIDGATPIRLGGVRLMAAGTELDDTVQGWTRSYDVTWNEYASSEAMDIEIMYILSFDNNYPEDDRNKVRYALTQRGIDIYGGYRSLGKWNSPNGGHSEPYDWYLLFAYLTTLDDDIKSAIDGTVGNEDNGTLKSIDDYDSKLHNIGSNLGQRYKTDPNDIVHPCRINGLNIVEIGTDADGIPYVEVEPPLSNIIGQGNPHNRLYHVAGNDDRSTDGPGPSGLGTLGRWGMKNNQSEINRGKFIGFYVRGSGGIARVIDNEGTVNTQTDAYGGNWFTDTPQRFYLQKDVVSPSDTTVDIAPFVREDLDVDGGADRAYFTAVNYSDVLGSMAGDQHYLYASTRQQLMVPFAASVLGGRDNLPEYWQMIYDSSLKYWSDPILTNLVNDNHASGTSYQFQRVTTPINFGHLFGALIRKFSLNGELPAEWGSGRLWKFNNWPHDDNYTWLEISNNPIQNPTAFLETPASIVSNSGSVVEDSSGSFIQEGNLLHRFIRTVTEDGRDGFFINSIATKGLSYSQYVSGRSLYVWQAGADNPIELDLVEETAPTTNNLIWNQTWALPEKYKTWPNTTVSWAMTNKYNIFFADPQPPEPS